MPTLNPNTSFILSGTSLGAYVFEQNPVSMNLVPPKQIYSTLRTLEGNDIYQRSFQDNEVRQMSWEKTSTTLYASLKTYATLDANGVIPTAYIWDGTVKEMQGVAIQIIDLHGQPLAADYSLMKVEMKFKPVTSFDKLYRCLNTSGLNAALTTMKVKVPDSTYTLQAYDDSFRPLLTGAAMVSFTSSTNEYVVTVANVLGPQTARTLLTFKNGWVTSKAILTGILSGSYFNLV